MKNLMIGLLSAVVLILGIMIGMTIYGRNARTLELENAVNTAQEYALNMLTTGEDNIPKSNEELASAFEMSLFSQLESRFLNLDVKIIDIDYEKGLIEAEVTEYYKHVNGRTGSITVKKMNMLENAYKKDAVFKYKIQFYNEDSSLYWYYTKQEGKRYTVPEAPEIEGEEFLGWAEYNKQTGEISETVVNQDSLKKLKVTKAQSYIAVYTKSSTIGEEDDE